MLKTWRYSTRMLMLNFIMTTPVETTSTGAKITGNLEVTGVLSYDDVTNVDSVNCNGKIWYSWWKCWCRSTIQIENLSLRVLEILFHPLRQELLMTI